MELIKTIDTKANFNIKDYMDYTNEDVLDRFQNMFQIPFEDVKDLFQETKKFLLLCYKYKDTFFINDDLLIIDEMWHNFILFTIEYQKFCKIFFGEFLHHTPASKKQKEDFKIRIKNDKETVRKEFEKEEEKMISIVYDYYGPETVIKWFQDYRTKYTKDYILSIMK